jgi:Domain of unknown function (DUF4252)
MKAIIIICALITLAPQFTQAQDRWLFWKYKDYDGSYSFYLPRPFVTVGSWFVKGKENRQMMRKVHGVRSLIFEGDSPVSKKDTERFMRKAKRHSVEDLIMVRSKEANVSIMAKERRGVLRRVVVFVKAEDTFVMVGMRGRFRIQEINKLLQKYGKDIRKDKKPVIPPVVKIPTEQV